MPHIEWTSALELGLPEIYRQHRSLVDLANRLFEALKDGRPTEDAAKAVAELFAYAATHFADEEAYFARFNLPDYARHAETHRSFMARVSDFEDRLHSGNPARLSELLAFTEGWIKRHIGREDRSLARIALRHKRG